jgi:hypothetical protein
MVSSKISPRKISPRKNNKVTTKLPMMSFNDSVLSFKKKPADDLTFRKKEKRSNNFSLDLKNETRLSF